MAQTGYTAIQLYYTTTVSATPTAGNLAAGELAINTADEKLYFKNSSGVVKLLASTLMVGTNGGTGVNNGSRTISYAGNIAFTGAFNPTFAIPSSSTYTFPTGDSTLVSTTGTVAVATAANGLKSATTTVSVSSATAPSAGQVLTASSTTAASWVTLSLPVGGITGLGTGVATFLATPSSANLATAMTDESGNGALLFEGGALGTPASGVISNCTGTPTLTGTNFSGTAASLTAGQSTAALGIKSATTTVSVSGATAPSAGQVLYATNSTTATWQSLLLNNIVAATGSATLANANNPIVWNWAQTTASQTAFTIGETSASTGGAGSQVLCKITTLAASTADPLQVQARGSDVIRVSSAGAVTVTGGVNGASGSSISITSGAAAGGTVGDLTLAAGANSGGSGSGGAATFSGGGGASGGTATLQGGTASAANGTGGSVSILAKAGGTTSGVGGSVSITSGAGVGSAGGGITLIGGASTSDRGGEITLTAGAGNRTDIGASVILTAGTNNGIGSGGGVSLSGGAGTTGGSVDLSGGITNSSTGQGGGVSIVAKNGGATSGAGGSVTITAGNSTSGNGGNITITAGTGTTAGRINFVNCNVANGAVATAMSSVGPAGANTAIQGWLAIQIGGTARYIPFW